MFQMLFIIGKYFYATIGAVIIPFILGYAIKKIETDSLVRAFIGALVLSGLSTLLIFILTAFLGAAIIFSNIVFILATFIIITSWLTYSFYKQEEESIGKKFSASFIPLGIYLIGYMMILPLFDLSISITILYLLAGLYLTFSDESELPNRVVFIIILSVLAFIAPFVKNLLPYYIPIINIPITAIILAILSIIIYFLVFRKVFESSSPKYILFFFIMNIILSSLILPPGLTLEARLAIEMSTKTAERHLKLYQQYLQIYREIQQNETLKKMYEAGTYEYPEQGSFLLEPHKGIVIDVKGDKTLKFWDRNNGEAYVEIYGEIENPLSTPIQVLVKLSNIRVVGLKEDQEIELDGYSWSCKFLKNELLEKDEDPVLNGLKGDGDIEIIHKESFEPFMCRVSIGGVPSYLEKIGVVFSVDGYYRVYTSSIVELYFMGSEKYTALWRSERLQPRKIQSVSTWGPLKGIIFVSGIPGDTNPISVDGSLDITLKIYTQRAVIDGWADMDCYIIAIPKNLEIIEYKPTSVCEEVTDGKLSCSKYIDISKSKALFYGYTIYNGYFGNLSKKGYEIVECNFGDRYDDFSYEGNPMKSDEVVLVSLRVKIGENDEMIVFPQAHFIYTFKQSYEMAPMTIFPG